VELQDQMHIPLLCSIPYIGHNGDVRVLPLRDRRDGALGILEPSASTDAPWASSHFIRSFADEIRARLILYFELKRTRHKPKLVAIAGCSQGAGTSTLAGGLAAALSETTEGKVLLVDMHDANNEMNPYFTGHPIFSLSDALDGGGAMCAAEDNLYLATASLQVHDRTSLSPREFYNMMPRFKASEFDYVIFDMPPMEESSSALAIARFMDKVLLVIESEKSNREAVRTAYSELRMANTNVSAILNKTRSYAPSWLGAGV
jgi:Mrp family chromosome partitioning ATPase